MINKNLRMTPLLLTMLSLAGCANQLATQPAPATASVEMSVPAETCPGDTELPPALMGKFEPVDDPALLASALKGPGEGYLCQGKVYQAKADATIILYRSWNSTNPNSRLGQWWAAQIPAGKTAQYREDYEICYNWSPLDKLTRCPLKAGAKVVIGTGQSAKCSAYLTYPTSAAKQVYIESAASVVDEPNCVNFDDQFNWTPVAPEAN